MLHVEGIGWKHRGCTVDFNRCDLGDSSCSVVLVAGSYTSAMHVGRTETPYNKGDAKLTGFLIGDLEFTAGRSNNRKELHVKDERAKKCSAELPNAQINVVEKQNFFLWEQGLKWMGALIGFG